MASFASKKRMITNWGAVGQFPTDPVAAYISDNVQMLQLGFFRTDQAIKFGNTPLHTACEWGSEKTVNTI